MRRGFTIIEMVLYLAILSTVVLALSSFLYLTYTARIRATVIAEVEQQGEQTMNLVTQNIRNSRGITAPAAGVSAAALILTEADGALSPTEFSLSAGAIQMKEGAGAAVSITSNRTVVTGLTFQNLSRPSTPGIVRIQFTLTHVNPSNRGEYTYSKVFTGTAAVRL